MIQKIMIESSFLNRKNKINFEFLTTPKHILYNCVFPWILLAVFWIGVPLSAFFLDRQINTKFLFPASLILMFLLGGVFLFIYGKVVFTISGLIFNLWIDLKNGIDNFQTQAGVVKSKYGMKTWGPEIDEYSITLEGENISYYVDKKLYSLIKTGKYVTLNFLPKSKVVIRYKIED